MDSKGLFDALDNDFPQDDRKFVLKPTKFKGPHSEPLFTLLRIGIYTLKGEKSELADRIEEISLRGA